MTTNGARLCALRTEASVTLVAVAGALALTVGEVEVIETDRRQIGAFELGVLSETFGIRVPTDGMQVLECRRRPEG